MYQFLTKYLPKPLADIAISLWYIFLILLIYFFSDANEAKFRYLGL